MRSVQYGHDRLYRQGAGTAKGTHGTEKKESAGLNPAVLLLVLAVMGGAAFAYFKFIKGKANHKNNSNPDDYDYEDGEELPDEEEIELEDEESGELDADRGGGEESEDETP